MMRSYVRKARGAGLSWRDLAGPLGVAEQEDDPAGAAFMAVAGEPRRRFDTQWVSWTCWSCGEAITDRGPYNGHPADDESGHADGCVRHAAEIATYQRRH